MTVVIVIVIVTQSTERCEAELSATQATAASHLRSRMPNAGCNRFGQWKGHRPSTARRSQTSSPKLFEGNLNFRALSGMIEVKRGQEPLQVDTCHGE